MKSTNAKSRTEIQEVIKYAYLNLGDLDQYDLSGPFNQPIFDLVDEHAPPMPLLNTMLNPKYLGWVAKEILNIDLGPFQNSILYHLWSHSFPMLIGSRGLSKSFLLAVYSLLRCLLIPNSKVVIVGAAFRQSKFLFEYITNIWRNAPILRDICGLQDSRQGPHVEPDKCTMVIGNSTITAIPIGDGQKIRGLRSTCTIVDELASLPKLILENVVIGFGAVMANPVENMKRVASIKKMRELNIPTMALEEDVQSNQLILSGTAYYSFNHFYEYWMQYRKIILSRGNPQKLKDVFKEGVPARFNWKDYCVIRIPYELIPEGFMDSKQVDRAKATISSTTYAVEYGAIFPIDSDGFYKRSLIETCTCKDDEPIILSSGSVYFKPTLTGISTSRYIYGVDPASQVDNFSIVIIELCEDHRRIVYVWTTDISHHKALLKDGKTEEDDFYGFCARKIRSLMKKFPCHGIALDTQGGGVAIQEALHSSKHRLPDEQPIWPIIEEDKEKETDDFEGLHILHLINFADANWNKEANHGMKYDFENKALLFPAFDTVSIGLAIEEDKRNSRTTDTLEDSVIEIEELKDELATIQHTQTANNRDRWDTPEVKMPGGKKGRQRKDRYSALVMANGVGRKMTGVVAKPEYNTTGGFANKMRGDSVSGPMSIGPLWYTQKANLYLKGLGGV